MSFRTLKPAFSTSAAIQHARTKRHAVSTRYTTVQVERLESAAQAFISGGAADADTLADDFISFADGVRFVNDLHKADYLKAAQEITSRGDFKVEQGFYAIDDNGSGSAFILLLGSSGAYPVPLIARMSVNDVGKVDKLWSRRGVLEGEKRLLRQPKAVFARMESTPQFVVKEVPPDSQANMLAALDEFLKALNAKSTAERVAIVQRFTSEGFQKWEGTSVWEPMTGLQVLDRQGLVASMGSLMSLGGASSGGTRVLIRGKAASSTHNLGFLHLCYLAANAEGPIALDVLLAFAFSSSGRHIKQAMGFRNAFRQQEYALAFNMDEDVGMPL